MKRNFVKTCFLFVLQFDEKNYSLNQRTFKDWSFWAINWLHMIYIIMPNFICFELNVERAIKLLMVPIFVLDVCQENMVQGFITLHWTLFKRWKM